MRCKKKIKQITKKKKRNLSRIWKTKALETIAYCLSRLLIGYRPYKPGIVVATCNKTPVICIFIPTMTTVY